MAAGKAQTWQILKGDNTVGERKKIIEEVSLEASWMIKNEGMSQPAMAGHSD